MRTVLSSARATAAVLGIAAVLVWRPHAQTPSSPLASTVVPASPALAALFGALERPLPPRSPDAPAPPNLRAFADKPMSINLTNVTVRGVLDQIIRQAGDLLWLARYRDADGTATALGLSFNGFDAGSFNINGRQPHP